MSLLSTIRLGFERLSRSGGQSPAALAGKLVRFVVVGGGATIAYGAFSLLMGWFTALAPMAVHLAAYGLCLPISFLAQGLWTFSYRGAISRAGVRFMALSALALALSSAVVFLCNTVLGLHRFVGVAATMVLVPAVSFIAMLFWVYDDVER